ncbi:hypothetical protein Dimus_014400 [Dionaea muscipula]
MGSLDEEGNKQPSGSILFNKSSHKRVALLDPEEFRRQGYMVVDFLAEYYGNIEEYPVRSQVEPGYLRKRVPDTAPYHPEPMETILRDVQKDIIPGLTHWQSPNHFAYFPSSASIAGILGETLAAGFNVVGFNWMASPAATELETIVMDWLAKALSLPKSFMFSSGSENTTSSSSTTTGRGGGSGGGGVLLGTTCEALLTTIVAARDRALLDRRRQLIIDVDDDDDYMIHRLVVYGSDQTHCSFHKSAKIAGIHPRNIRKIKTTRLSGFGLSPQLLRLAIEKDVKAGLIPLFLCATVGTTSTTSVDPIRPLCDVAKDYGIWVHIDAAYAGNACICPEFRQFIDGVEGADSFSFNAHKWMFTTLDCCCLWVKDPSTLVRALSTSPEYLRNKASECNQVIDYKDWQIALSRRFRSLKLWLVLRSYGISNLRKSIRKHVNMAAHFEGLIVKYNYETFEIVVPRLFATVCFRISPTAVIQQLLLCPTCCQRQEQKHLHDHDHVVNAVNHDLLESINSSGRLYMTHGVVDGVYFIRFAVGASLTEGHHVIRAWSIVQEHSRAILGRQICTCSTSCDREASVASDALQLPLNVHA